MIKKQYLLFYFVGLPIIAITAWYSRELLIAYFIITCAYAIILTIQGK